MNSGSMETLDGLEVLRAVLSLREVMSLIERTARWVDPKTFGRLPVWYPEHARRAHFFKENWTQPQMNKSRQTGNSVHKMESNTYANEALTLALGMRKQRRPNWSCCHIWGVDDAKYQQSNLVVADRRFYSCIGNMVLLPTPLKAFTDTIADVKTMLRICARNLYGWQCDHDSVLASNSALDSWSDWDAYPHSWPRQLREKMPLGVVPISPRIESAAEKRLQEIKHDLKYAGSNYPRAEVRAVLQYWGIAA
jgi:hypothetical protein